MDFFDPKKQKKHAIRLAIGYALIGAVVLLATIILLYQARGYWVDETGRIIQNGLVFVSSQPRGSDIYLNGQKSKKQTNARLNLASGQYLMELKRNGYTDWKRILTVEGGSVERFDYPLLFPLNPETARTKQYDASPPVTTASPDGRWLLVAVPGQDAFDLFDMDAKEPVAQTLAVPEDILAAGSTTRGWQVTEWSSDDRRVLFRRSFERLGQNNTEYILFDRADPEASLNLSVTLGFAPDKIELRNGAFDRYYLHDKDSGQIFTASLDSPTPQPLISSALAFAADNDVVAYVTTKGAPDGKVLIRLKRGADNPLNIKALPAGTSYVLDMAIYSDKLYVAAGAASDNRVFLYKDPLGALRSRPTEPLVPVQILKVDAPNYVSFSPGSRLVMAESKDRFSVYDAETDRGYVFSTGAPLDKPQTHAKWLDGFHLSYISEGRAVVFDFDGTNAQKLVASRPGHAPILDRRHSYIYTVNPDKALVRMALLTAADL